MQSFSDKDSTFALDLFKTHKSNNKSLMPRYLHIPHTPDTARTLTLSGRNRLAVSGMTTPPF